MDTRVKALQDAVFLTKVAGARRTPMDEKILDGQLRNACHLRFNAPCDPTRLIAFEESLSPGRPSGSGWDIARVFGVPVVPGRS